MAAAFELESEGTIVERTTYGQYDRCSRSTSSCLRGCVFAFDAGAPAEDSAAATPFVCGGEMNAHRPILRWHSAQWRSVVSGFDCTRPGLPGATERDGRSEPGVGVPSRRDITEGARDNERAGVDGATEFARESDWVRARSEGGAGGRIAHPNSDVTIAVSDGSGEFEGVGGSSWVSSPGSASGTANVGSVTDESVDTND